MNISELVTGSLMRRLVLLVLLVLCSYWIFIDAYRLNAFDIVPHDDYAPYLLYILGEEGGKVPGSPFMYRLFSVAAAIPFFYVLPVYEFTLLENVDTTYLRAVESLAMVSYLSILVSSIVIYTITTRRFGGSASAGLIASLGTLLIMQFSGYKGIDPIGIMLVCLLISYSRNLIVFGIIIMLSVGVNEKISLVMSVLMVSRYLIYRDNKTIPYAILSLLAFATYLAVRTALNIPGSEHQMQVYSFMTNAWENILDMFSLRRIVLVVMPLTMLGILYALAAREYRANVQRYQQYFSIADISALLGLFMVTLAVGMRYGHH